MYRLQRKLHSQNFLHNRNLVERLVRGTSIGKQDLVLEIGPGKGIITEPLLKRAQHVVAVEIDRGLYQYLQKKFSTSFNFTLYQADFLSFDLPRLPYKVFANIPFAVEGQIIRKLIDDPHPPDDCYLVTLKELAYRLAAPYRENQFSLQHKPWFTFSIIHHFQRTDFSPYPNVDAVLFKFTKRQEPLLSLVEQKTYQAFIAVGFGQGLAIARNLKRRYGDKPTMRAFHHLGLKKRTLPTDLTLEQWIALYRKLHPHLQGPDSRQSALIRTPHE